MTGTVDAQGRPLLEISVCNPARRWLIAVMGTALQLCLGTVYAWSYFQQPLVDGYGWSQQQVAWVFSLAIGCLGLAAACGGVLLPRFGPRRLAIGGGLLFGGGYLLAALALELHSLPLLYLGYGVVGGAGLGLGYVTPVATVARWFPDKKGLVTGMVIMGFGLGALLMSKFLAPQLMRALGGDLPRVFAALGATFVVLAPATAWFLQNPPAQPAAAGSSTGATPASGSALRAVASGRFLVLWLVFFCNILAGISIIGFQSPLLQDLWRALDSSLPPETLAAYGATLIAVSSLFNGLGRIFWGGLSDRLGRLTVFRLMLASQIAVFLLLRTVHNPWLFAGLICYVLLCYGGGFGTMPALVLDAFGPQRMAAVYGTVLTAWSAGGMVGPQIVARLKDACPQQAASYSFALGAGVLAAGLLLAMLPAGRPTGEPR